MSVSKLGHNKPVMCVTVIPEVCRPESRAFSARLTRSSSVCSELERCKSHSLTGSGVWMSLLFVLTHCSFVTAQESDLEFDWPAYRVSPADLFIAGESLHSRSGEPASSDSLGFNHEQIELSEAEQESYARLWREIDVRRFSIQSDIDRQPRSRADEANLWQSSFYEFEAARRLAWKNGQLTIFQQEEPSPDASTSAGTGPVPSIREMRISRRSLIPGYSLAADMASYPDDFIGRPIAVYGLFSPLGVFELRAGGDSNPDETIRLQRGKLLSLQGNETLAIVDSAGYIGPDNQDKPEETWRVKRETRIPVLVKGWFVKLRGRKQPLIVTEAVRVITERPFDQLIRTFSRPRSGLTEDEKWLYYETLRQMQLTDSELQSRSAMAFLQRRLRDLMSEIRDKAAGDRILLDADLNKGRIEVEEHRVRTRRLQRQVAVRLDRHEKYLADPSTFPTYVDVFQNPDKWHGSLVTLSGHVRRVVTYPGDAKLFGGQQLHELWLFTDDSQRNPAVIVTPVLPRDFPVEAEVVDRVFVTGCFFKPYVYRSDGDHRIAPLILAGRVAWSPTDQQVRALAAEGVLPPTSPLVTAAVRRAGKGISETGVMLIGFLSLLIMMTVWGRVQRDRRERGRLRSLVDSGKDFDQTFSAASACLIPEYNAGFHRE